MKRTEVFSVYDVKVRVSLDGDGRANDQHRIYRDGRSRYDEVVAVLSRLGREDYRHLYVGLLCTVDIANDPIDVYRGLIEQELPRSISCSHMPRGPTSRPSCSRPTLWTIPSRGGVPDGASEYGTWLWRTYDAWDADGRHVPIRILDAIIGALHGWPSKTESLGLVLADLLAIETDGSFEKAHSLKMPFDGASAIGFDVSDWRPHTPAPWPAGRRPVVAVLRRRALHAPVRATRRLPRPVRLPR